MQRWVCESASQRVRHPSLEAVTTMWWCLCGFAFCLLLPGRCAACDEWRECGEDDLERCEWDECEELDACVELDRGLRVFVCLLFALDDDEWW